jgi:hypothetical protein
MFVGNTGTGKSAMMMNKLNRMDPEATMFTTINMNSFSDAPSLQVRVYVCLGAPGNGLGCGVCVDLAASKDAVALLLLSLLSLLSGHDGAATGEEERRALRPARRSQVCACGGLASLLAEHGWGLNLVPEET